MQTKRSKARFTEPSIHINLFLPEGMARKIDEYREDTNKSAAYRKVLEAGLRALADEKD